MKIQKSTLFISFMLIMFVLGISDSLRGVFSPVFMKELHFSAVNLSWIVSISYLGNLVFMIVGSKAVDKQGVHKPFFFCLLAWIISLAILMFTGNYLIMLMGFFISMGASTTINIILNIYSVEVFSNPVKMINLLFFVQGIGTTLSQSYLGASVNSLTSWYYVLSFLILVGLVAIILYFNQTKFAKESADNNTSQSMVGEVAFAIKDYRTLFFYILIFGFYFVGEHGVINWLNLFAREGLSLAPEQAAQYPALFFGGLTLGRLLFSSVVSRLEIRKAICIFFSLGTIVYTLSYLLPSIALYLYGVSGLLLSIIYPTLTMSLQLYFDRQLIGKATGIVMSFATIFDVIFNSMFGMVIANIGIKRGVAAFPISMILAAFLYLVVYLRVKPVNYLSHK